MKIIFMGTPDFAIPSLKILLESNHKIISVVTGIDKERGRGQKLSFTPIKEFAIKKDIPVLQPQKLKDEQFVSKLKSLNADLFVVVAFKILAFPARRTRSEKPRPFSNGSTVAVTSNTG